MAAGAVANPFVDSVYLVDEFIRVGVDLPLQVKVRNGGDQDAAAVQVRVLVGDRQVGSYQVDLTAGATAVNTVRVRLADAKPQLGRVELEGLPVTFDNVYYFTLTPSGRIRIMDVSAGATAAQKLYPNESTFSYALLNPSAVTAAGLAATDMLLLQGTARLGSEQRNAVQQFAQQGGTVVVVPPPNAALRKDFDQLLADLELTMVRWNNANGSAPQDLAMPNRQNPFFKDVFSEQVRQPDLPRATPLLTWGRSTTDVLQFRDGQPFLSGFRRGQGMVYVFASPLQNGFSTFAEHPLFVPVMYRLATLSKSTPQLPAYRLTDRAVVLRQPDAGSEEREKVYKLSNDSATFIPAQQTRNGRLYLQLPPEMRQAGFYRLTEDGQELGTLAFNVDKKESELARYSAEELRQMVANYPNVHVYEAGGERSAASQFAEERTGTPLWRYCLVAALLCLLGEALVLRFARRGERTVATAA
ncbi:hypothetical protein GCM10027048_37580 [Hymenobacter coalescens]